MRAPLLLLGVISVAAAASDPGVFDDYFDDQLRSVDIPQESALKACLSNGDATGKKIQTAYDGCFGTDYDFNDLADNEEGKDSDGDDLPDEYEANEACFYTAMGWVSADGKDVSLDTLEADMAGLEEAVAKDFKANAKSCSKWSGDFGGGRRKREAGEEDVVPDLMASGRRSLGWVKSMARKTRSAEKEKKKGGKKTGKGKNAKKGKGKRKGEGKQVRKGDKKKAAKKGKGKKKGEGKVKNGKGKGAGRNSKEGKGKKGKGASRNNKKGKGKNGNGANRNKKGGKEKKVKGAGRNNKKGKGKKGKGAGRKQRGGKGKKGKGAGRNNKKEKGGKEKGAGRPGSKAKKGKGGKGGEKKGTKKEGNKKRNGKGDKEKQMDEKVYNKLWCFDLAVEQALEECVEDKIKN